MPERIPSVQELEEMLKEMARQHPSQKDRHIPQTPVDAHTKQKVVVPKAAPQKKIRKGTQKGQ